MITVRLGFLNSGGRLLAPGNPLGVGMPNSRIAFTFQDLLFIPCRHVIMKHI